MESIDAPATYPKFPLRRILAVLLSLVSTGLGQVVIGRVRSGILWFAVTMLFFAGFIGSIVIGSPIVTLLFLFAIVMQRIGGTIHTALIRAHPHPPRSSVLAAIGIGMYLSGIASGLIGLQFVKAYRMPTPSMFPTLQVGDYFMGSQLVSGFSRGQVIVIRYPPDPSKSYVQRVIGLPGDTLEMKQGGLILNGSLVERRQLSDSCATSMGACTFWQETLGQNSYTIVLNDGESLFDSSSRDFGPITIPEGHLFVLGDNRDNSADSRYWGFVPLDLVQANPRFLYWSAGDDGVRWHRITQQVK